MTSALFSISIPGDEFPCRPARGPAGGEPEEVLALSGATALFNPAGPSAGLAAAESEGPVPGGWVYAPPSAGPEIWASGVTYLRSRTARMEESEGAADAYDRVYEAERPELFLKANANDVRATGDPVGIRADSTWDVPEPEIALVVSPIGKIVGYTIGNDMSSRSIEGENPLYLPQAKVYDGSCALGPCIVPADAIEPPFEIRMTIERGGVAVFEGETSTAQMKRTFEELAAYLVKARTFPSGAALLTGTGIVPPNDFTLQAGDVVSITVPGIGTLTNPVEVVGTP